MIINFNAEIARKSVHLSSLWIPLLYLYTAKETTLLILLPLTIISVTIDFSRRFIPKLNNLINHLIGYMMRDNEKEFFAFSGATNMLIAASLTIIFFSQEAAILALTILMISDSFAAIIGRKFGKIILIDGKSLEGSLSFAVSAIMVYYFFNLYYHYDLPLDLSLLAIFAATIAELFAKKIHLDDNLVIPLIIGIVLSLG